MTHELGSLTSTMIPFPSVPATAFVVFTIRYGYQEGSESRHMTRLGDISFVQLG
jgi:hypothetical protein